MPHSVEMLVFERATGIYNQQQESEMLTNNIFNTGDCAAVSFLLKNISKNPCSTRRCPFPEGSEGKFLTNTSLLHVDYLHIITKLLMKLPFCVVLEIGTGYDLDSVSKKEIFQPDNF